MRDSSLDLRILSSAALLAVFLTAGLASSVSADSADSTKTSPDPATSAAP